MLIESLLAWKYVGIFGKKYEMQGLWHIIQVIIYNV